MSLQNNRKNDILNRGATPDIVSSCLLQAIWIFFCDYMSLIRNTLVATYPIEYTISYKELTKLHLKRLLITGATQDTIK